MVMRMMLMMMMIVLIMTIVYLGEISQEVQSMNIMSYFFHHFFWPKNYVNLVTDTLLSAIEFWCCNQFFLDIEKPPTLFVKLRRGAQG